MNLARFFGMTRSQIVDLSVAREGTESFLPRASVEAALVSLKRFGLVIVKNAFEPSKVSGLMQNAIEHGKAIEAIARSGGKYSFDPSYDFGESSLACDVTALDPATRSLAKPDITQTTLWRTMVTPLIRDVLLASVGRKASWTRARARVIVPGLQTGKADGKLPLHLEKLAFKYPGIHNLWTPLVPQDVVTNADTSGLQFYIGQLETFENLAPETESAVYAVLRQIGPGVNSQVPLADEKGFFYRPKMRAGDVAIFSGSIPHAGFVPTGTTLSRVACDIRVFPRTDLEGARPLDL